MTLPVGHKYTPAGTPYHLTQLTGIFLQEVFTSYPDDHQFKYVAGEENFEATGVLFDYVYNKESEKYGKKPVVIVSSGPVSNAPIVVGDRASTAIETMNSTRSSLVRSSVTIKAVADIYDVSELLGTEIYNILLTGRVLFPRLSTIHQVDSITMTPVATFDEGDHMYYCEVTLNYSVQYKWKHVLPQEVLNSVIVRINERSLV